MNLSTERSCSRNRIHSNVSITGRDELVWKVGDPYTPGSVERMLSRRCYRSRYLLACEPSDRSRLMARSVMNVAARATAITASWYHKSRLPRALGHLRAAFISFMRACAYAASVRIIINTGIPRSCMKLTWARILHCCVSLMSSGKRVSPGRYDGKLPGVIVLLTWKLMLVSRG